MIDQMRENWIVTGDGAEGQRAAFETLARCFPTPEYAEHSEGSLEGVPVIVTTDRTLLGTAPRNILYLHGGAFVIGSASIYREQSARIARAAGAAVYSVDYRRAPEHRFPAALDDTVSAYLGLLELGIPSQEIVLAGDSAGANLALGACLRLRETGSPLPAGMVLLSPWADLGCSGDSMYTNANARHLAQRPGLLSSASAYLGATDPRHPDASPLFAHLSSLPDMLIQVGSKETLLDDSRSLDRRARAAGTQVRLEIYEGMVHEWHLLSALLPPDEPLEDAEHAIDSIGTFVREVTAA